MKLAILIFTALFVGLKLAGEITWSWIWVFAPVWIVPVVVLLLIVILAVLVGLEEAIGGKIQIIRRQISGRKRINH